jgi:glycosyltransferase involved in cell wall biosynthesis
VRCRFCLEIVQMGRDQGRGSALKRCLSYVIASCPKYLGWLDDDDWLHPQCLELCFKFLVSDKSYELVYTHYYDVAHYGQLLGLGKRCNIPYSQENLLLNFLTFHYGVCSRL